MRTFLRIFLKVFICAYLGLRLSAILCIINNMVEFKEGDLLEKLRESSGLTQEQLAKKANIRAATISDNENAVKCSRKCLDKVLPVLGLKLSEFYSELEALKNSESIKFVEHSDKEKTEFLREIEEAFKKENLRKLIIVNTKNIIYTFTNSGSPVSLEEKEKLGTRPKLLRP